MNQSPDPRDGAPYTDTAVEELLDRLMSRPENDLHDGALLVVTVQPDHTLIVDAVEIEEPADIPYWWAQLTSPAELAHAPGSHLVVIACTGADTTAALQNINRHPRVQEVIRVHHGSWSSISRPDEGPSEGHQLRALTHPRAGDWLINLTHAGPDDEDHLRDLLRPGTPALLRVTQFCLDQLTARQTQANNGPAGDREPLTAVQMLAHAVHERDARADGPAALHPASAAVLLLGLNDEDVWGCCLAWDDSSTWWLWLDLIPHAPPGLVALLTSLIANMALFAGASRMARVAAQHALDDNPDTHLKEFLTDLRDLSLSPSELGEHTHDLFGPRPDDPPPTNP